MKQKVLFLIIAALFFLFGCNKAAVEPATDSEDSELPENEVAILTLGVEKWDYEYESPVYENPTLRENNRYTFGYLYPQSENKNLTLMSADVELQYFNDGANMITAQITYVVENTSRHSIKTPVAFGDQFPYIYRSGDIVAHVMGLETTTLEFQPGRNSFTVYSDSMRDIHWPKDQDQLQANELLFSFENLHKWHLADNFQVSCVIGQYGGDYLLVMDDLPYTVSEDISIENNCYSDKEPYWTPYLTYTSSEIPSETIDIIYPYEKTPQHLPNRYATIGETVRLRDDGTITPPDSSPITLAKNTKVTLLSIGNGDWLNGIISNWCEVEIADGECAGVKGTMFGSTFMQVFAFGIDPVLETAFMNSSPEHMHSEDYDAISDWITEKCNAQDLESILGYCAEADKWGFFDQSFNTAPNPLLVMIKEGYEEGMSTLLDQYPKLANHGNAFGMDGEIYYTPANQAVSYNRPEMLEELLTRGANVQQYVSFNRYFGPIKNNLLTICSSDETREILMAHGIATSYECALECTIKSQDGDTVRIYNEPSESASYTEYTVTESNNDFQTLEIGFENAESIDTTNRESVGVNRWVRVTGHDITGWIRPNETFLPEYQFEP